MDAPLGRALRGPPGRERTRLPPGEDRGRLIRRGTRPPVGEGNQEATLQAGSAQWPAFQPNVYASATWLGPGVTKL